MGFISCKVYKQLLHDSDPVIIKYHDDLLEIVLKLFQHKQLLIILN